MLSLLVTTLALTSPSCGDVRHGFRNSQCCGAEASTSADCFVTTGSYTHGKASFQLNDIAYFDKLSGDVAKGREGYINPKRNMSGTFECRVMINQVDTVTFFHRDYTHWVYPNQKGNLTLSEGIDRLTGYGCELAVCVNSFGGKYLKKAGRPDDFNRRWDADIMAELNDMLIDNERLTITPEGVIKQMLDWSVEGFVPLAQVNYGLVGSSFDLSE